MKETSITYQEKTKELQRKIEEWSTSDVMLAFSGGVDSSLLLCMFCEAARKSGTLVYAVTVHTELHPMGDLVNAKKVAAEMGAVHEIIKADELEHAGIQNNPVDRCYRCKKYLFERIKKLAASKNVLVVVEGTNADDLHSYRPGIRAVRELEIKSPLAKVGFTKSDVRRLAADYGLSVSTRPALPCLATRFPYGTLLTKEKMEKVEKGEEYIRSLGFYNVRVRVHENIARVEVDKEAFTEFLEKRQEIVTYLKDIGYDYVTLDMSGFCSGSMDVHVKESQV